MTTGVLCLLLLVCLRLCVFECAHIRWDLCMWMFVEELEGSAQKVVPFLACGDLSGYDADKNYAAEGPWLDPIHPPINPPYKESLEGRRKGAAESSSS